MNIQRKSKERIDAEALMLKSDVDMEIIRSDLYWTLNENTYPKYLRKWVKLRNQREKDFSDWVLTLRICPNKHTSIHSDSKVSTTVSNVVVEFWWYKKHLHHHDSLKTKDDNSKLNIWIQIGDFVKNALSMKPKINNWGGGETIHSIQWLKIVLQHDNGSDEMDIPELDKSNILQYLIEWKPPIELDCQSFIHKAKWLKMRTNWENFSIIADKRMMEKVNITILRDGQQRALEVTLGQLNNR